MAGREAHRNRQRLEYKFITEYVRNIHKDIYDEANSFYKTVKENNPGVLDLTKTVEFMERAKPYEYIPRYYYIRRRRTTTTTARKQTELTMALSIPLMTMPSLAQPSPVTVPPAEEPLPLAQPSPVTVPPAEEPLPLAQPSPVTVPPAEEPLPLAQPSPVTVPPTEEPLPLAAPSPVIVLTPADPLPLAVPSEDLKLPEEQYQQLLQELNQDPDLHMLFNNFDIPSDDEGMNPQVWNDISTQNNTTSMEIS